MAEHKHSCSHSHPDPDREPILADEHDPAMKSLADAMRVSFRVLSAIMVLFLVLFLATGLQSISSQEVGLVKVFGKVTRTADAGFVYNWPFPIGEIQPISTAVQTLDVDNFWLQEAKGEQTPLAKRGRKNDGLRPGFDGALLTGDRNLIHVRLQCKYQIKNARAAATRIEDLSELVRESINKAAIHAASQRTFDAILTNHLEFLAAVQDRTQMELNQLLGGETGEMVVKINEVLLQQGESITWPLAAYTAYEEAQTARAERQNKIDTAIGEARNLAGVIGERSFTELVGQPWNASAREEERMRRAFEQNESYNLIGQWNHARETGQDEKARMLGEKIDIVLTRATAGGEASKVIANAQAEKTRTIEQAKERARRFRDLLPKYRESPEVLLETMWYEVVDEILSAPMVTKWYLSPGRGWTVVKISQDPEIQKELMRKKHLQQGGTAVEKAK
jgi:regulator of protease activity HflC (stomatin/prohibitin superfamily)